MQPVSTLEARPPHTEPSAAFTHLEQPFLVVTIPDVNHTITTASGKGAKARVVCDSIHREHHINTILVAAVALQ